MPASATRPFADSIVGTISVDPGDMRSLERRIGGIERDHLSGVLAMRQKDCARHAGRDALQIGVAILFQLVDAHRADLPDGGSFTQHRDDPLPRLHADLGCGHFLEIGDDRVGAALHRDCVLVHIVARERIATRV